VQIVTCFFNSYQKLYKDRLKRKSSNWQVAVAEVVGQLATFPPTLFNWEDQRMSHHNVFKGMYYVLILRVRLLYFVQKTREAKGGQLRK